MAHVRGLSDHFIGDLENGLLRDLCTWVRHDNSLMMAIRDDYINLYYRGGSLLKLSRARQSYKAEFNPGYNDHKRMILPTPPKTIRQPADVQAWLDAFPALKQTMDFYKSKKSSSEREFQQVVVKENNRKPIGKNTDYFIVDIEMAFPRDVVKASGEKECFAAEAEPQPVDDLETADAADDIKCKIDLIALKVDPKDKSPRKTARLALVEMKYGTGSLGGSAGLEKHFSDSSRIAANPALLQVVKETALKQAEQLGRLGMWETGGDFVISDEKPEVIALIANHGTNPAGIKKVLSSPEITRYDNSPNYDLRFFVARSAGYGLFARSMLTLPEYLHSLS